MGEAKKIYIVEVAALCWKWLPAYRTADKLKEIGVLNALKRNEFVPLSDIVFNSLYGASGVHRILKAGIRAGIVEKNPAGGRGPLYRAAALMFKLPPIVDAVNTLHAISANADIFETLNIEPHNVTGLCNYTYTRQTTISLKMKALAAGGWVVRDQRGKEVWYSLSDQTRAVLPAVAAALGKL